MNMIDRYMFHITIGVILQKRAPTVTYQLRLPSFTVSKLTYLYFILYVDQSDPIRSMLISLLKLTLVAHCKGDLILWQS